MEEWNIKNVTNIEVIQNYVSYRIVLHLNNYRKFKLNKK